MKQSLVRKFLPLVRAYIRYAPGDLLKSRIWRRIGWISYPFRVSTRFGAVISGNAADVIQSHIYYFGLWEPRLTDWIAESVGAGDVFVDCGANIGYFSLFASNAVGPSGRVVAVEASPSIFASLQQQIALNHCQNVTCVNAALGASPGVVNIFFGPGGNSALTSIEPGRGGTVEASVSMIPLVDVIALADRPRVRLIKIDVEGAELGVVQGIGDLSEYSHPDLEVCVEVSPSSEAILQMMGEAGFTAYLDPNDYGDLRPYLRRRSAPSLERFKGPLTEQVDLLFSRVNAERLTPRPRSKHS